MSTQLARFVSLCLWALIVRPGKKYPPKLCLARRSIRTCVRFAKWRSARLPARDMKSQGCFHGYQGAFMDTQPGRQGLLKTQRLRNCHAGDGNRFSNAGVLKLFPSKGILRVRVVCGIFQGFLRSRGLCWMARWFRTKDTHNR